MDAILQYDVPLVTRLLADGADPNCYEWNVRPLHIAIDREADQVSYGLSADYGPISGLLVEHGADMMLPDANGQTPRDWARQLRHPLAGDQS
jgi:hypothetical protein